MTVVTNWDVATELYVNDTSNLAEVEKDRIWEARSRPLNPQIVFKGLHEYSVSVRCSDYYL